MLKILLSAWLSLAAVCTPLSAFGDTMDSRLHKAVAGRMPMAIAADVDRGGGMRLHCAGRLGYDDIVMLREETGAT
ncbi:hypothetical protein [Rhizobium sp. A37_96]